MKITDTISVNPGKDALGHVESKSANILRASVLGKEAQSLSLSQIMFPSVNSGLNEFKKYDVPLRTIFATVLIVTGLTLLTAGTSLHSLGLGIPSLCFGAFLALGFLTRPVMLGASIYYCVCGALSIRSGATDITLFSLMFGCLIFAVVGAGKYSCDTLIRNFIKSSRIHTEKKRKEDMMGYKAFHHAR